jgi:hypothetical protein
VKFLAVVERAESAMTTLLFRVYALSVSLAIPILAGCGENGRPLPAASMPLAAARSSPASSGAKVGVYVDALTGASNSAIFGYHVNRRRKPPICRIERLRYADNVAVDGVGNLIVTNGHRGSVSVYKGPDMCGPELGSLRDTVGRPSDAASNNAATGTIAIGNALDVSGPGSILVCTLPKGCSANLLNPKMSVVGGVALANNGDCWASAIDASSGAATLIYFKHCSGSGRAATGYKNKGDGGLDIDAQGNLVAISSSGSQTSVYVYKGCNRRCSLVGGPFALPYQAMRGHLNKDSSELAMANVLAPQVDVYSYSPTNISYKFSFKINGISAVGVEGVAYNPRSKQ